MWVMIFAKITHSILRNSLPECTFRKVRLPYLPRDAEICSRAQGNYAKYLIVIPSLDVAMVTLGHSCGQTLQCASNYDDALSLYVAMVTLQNIQWCVYRITWHRMCNKLGVVLLRMLMCAFHPCFCDDSGAWCGMRWHRCLRAE